jgi:hypothetical protein
LGRFLGYSAFFLAISVAVINVGFLGHGTLYTLWAWGFRSAGFRSVQAALAPVPWLRLPVPYPYVEGLDWVLADERARASTSICRVSSATTTFPVGGSPPITSTPGCTRSPLGTQALILAAVVAYAVCFRRFRFRRDEWSLLCPVLFSPSTSSSSSTPNSASDTPSSSSRCFTLLREPAGRTAAARPLGPGRRGDPRGLDRGIEALLSGEALEFRDDRLLTATVGAERPLGVTLEALSLE